MKETELNGSSFISTLNGLQINDVSKNSKNDK